MITPLLCPTIVRSKDEIVLSEYFHLSTNVDPFLARDCKGKQGRCYYSQHALLRCSFANYPAWLLLVKRHKVRRRSK